ncbi:MAG: ABC-three component system middle component 2 [Sphaerochaetaceae bacterium]
MTKVFNSPLEVSIRLMLLLSLSSEPMTIDRIAAFDFMALFSKQVGLSEKNIQGDNEFCFSEYASRRPIIVQAIKDLVLYGLIDVKVDNNGYSYQATPEGRQRVAFLKSEYAVSYQEQIVCISNAFQGKTDLAVNKFVNEKAIKEMRS